MGRETISRNLLRRSADARLTLTAKCRRLDRLGLHDWRPVARYLDEGSHPSGSGSGPGVCDSTRPPACEAGRDGDDPLRSRANYSGRRSWGNNVVLGPLASQSKEAITARAERDRVGAIRAPGFRLQATLFRIHEAPVGNAGIPSAPELDAGVVLAAYGVGVVVDGSVAYVSNPHLRRLPRYPRATVNLPIRSGWTAAWPNRQVQRTPMLSAPK